MKNNILRGTVLLSSASFLSKILGFIYIIPFTALVGSGGYALYKYAYGPYTIMLSISTMGIPLAISQMVSKYDHLERDDIIQKILKSGLVFMVISGIISFIFLYAASPFLAGIVVDKKSSTGNSLDSVIYTIKMVSFALIIVPPMSFLRGFFQGYQSMGPSALSTVLEQLARVVFIVVGAYVVLNWLDMSVTTAVGVGTFGAFVGALFGLAVLVFYLLKRFKLIFRHVDALESRESITIPQIYKEVFKYSIPYVVIGMGLPLYQNADTFTINAIFMNLGYSQSDAETVNSVIGLAQILVLIPVSITTGLSVSIIPSMTKAFVDQNVAVMRNQFNQSLLVLMTIILPAAFGMMLLADPLYFLLFGKDNFPELGGQMLKLYAPVAILMAFYGTTSSVLQSINEHKKVILGLLIGLLVKIILNAVLPRFLQEDGFIWATYGGYFVSLVYNLFLIKKLVGFNLKSIKHRLISVGIAAIAMIIVLSIALIGLRSAIHLPGEKLSDLIIVLITVFLGMIVYGGTIFAMNRKGFLNKSSE